MNQREFTRVRSRIPVDVHSAAGDIACTTRDVSLNGMWVQVQPGLPEETRCRVTLHLDGRGGQITVRADGVVVRSVPDGFGVQFLELLELDSYEHLRNLIQYNAEDPSQVAHEFDSHLGLKRVDPTAKAPD